MVQKERIKEIVKILDKQNPNAVTELVWDKNYPYQLVVAVMLSAQATDKGVNKVTKTMFNKYKTPEEFSKASYEDLIKHTKSINYYKTKTERIIKNAGEMINLYNSKIPKTIKELTKLSGIGNKSANVILQEVYGMGLGIVVDTHMTRVSNRLKLQKYNDQKYAKKIEEDLNKKVPKELYTKFSRLIVLHGRYTCKAQKPDCQNCQISKHCPYYKLISKKTV